MFKYLVIHNSDNWMSNPYISSFETLEGAELYVENWKTYSKYHKHDSVIIVKILSRYVCSDSEQTLNGPLYKFKKV